MQQDRVSTEASTGVIESLMMTHRMRQYMEHQAKASTGLDIGFERLVYLAPYPKIPKHNRRSSVQNLARIHDVLRVDCPFDGVHQVNCITVLCSQILHFAHPNPMFAGASAIQRQRPHYKPFI